MLLLLRPYHTFIGYQFVNQDVNLTNGDLRRQIMFGGLSHQIFFFCFLPFCATDQYFIASVLCFLEPIIYADFLCENF